MIQIQPSDIDPDREMIQIQSSDVDPDLVMMSHDDPDREMIQIRWWRWIEYEEDLKTKMTWIRDDPADTEKKTSSENCVERIPS